MNGEGIVWGVPSGEVVREGDTILPDLQLFENQAQPDGNLCNYVVAAALIHLGRAGDVSASLCIVERVGFLNVAQILKGQNSGEDRLTSIKLIDLVVDRVQKQSGEVVSGVLGVKETGYESGATVSMGRRLVGALEGGYISAIVIGGDHSGLVVGHSEDKQELIVWDSLTGSGNPKLRRLPVDDQSIAFQTAVKMNPAFAFGSEQVQDSSVSGPSSGEINWG